MKQDLKPSGSKVWSKSKLYAYYEYFWNNNYIKIDKIFYTYNYGSRILIREDILKTKRKRYPSRTELNSDPRKH